MRRGSKNLWRRLDSASIFHLHYSGYMGYKIRSSRLRKLTMKKGLVNSVARRKLVRDQEVGGSNPLAPTILSKYFAPFFTNP